MATRRSFLRGAASAALTAPALLRKALAEETLTLDPQLPTGLRGAAALEALPGKVPLIKLTYRPPNYETPLHYFNELFTPNEAFFVRYHLSDIPEVDPNTWRLAVGGASASKPFELTLDALRRDFTPVEIAAVCQCSGNRRGLFEPHVAGVEWGYGAMGNARWKGVRLKDILDRAGLAKETVEISFEGADGPPLDKTPDFVKSIPVWKALDPDTLVAYEMNGQPLPHFNGAPARVIVPGWTATYWMKHVTRISPRDHTRGQFLDEGGLPHSHRQVSGRSALPQPRDGSQHPDHRNGRELRHHDTGRGRHHRHGLTAHGQGRRLGRRLRHHHGRNLH